MSLCMCSCNVLLLIIQYPRIYIVGIYAYVCAHTSPQVVRPFMDEAIDRVSVRIQICSHLNSMRWDIYWGPAPARIPVVTRWNRTLARCSLAWMRPRRRFKCLFSNTFFAYVYVYSFYSYFTSCFLAHSINFCIPTLYMYMCSIAMRSCKYSWVSFCDVLKLVDSIVQRGKKILQSYCTYQNYILYKKKMLINLE